MTLIIKQIVKQVNYKAILRQQDNFDNRVVQ